MKNTYTIIIIGAGIVGTAAARELSRYTDSILLLEKARDVSMGATRANSGIVHGGYTAKAGTLKGELSIRGNRMYRQLSEELGFPYRRNGSYVLAFTDEDREKLQQLFENGQINGVEQLELHTGRQVRASETRINPAVAEGLYCGETGIVSPYEAAIALAENAAANGAVLKLSHEVTHIEQSGELFQVAAGGARYSGNVIVNAAGLYSDHIAAMAGADRFSIKPRKGEYLLLRRGTGDSIGKVIFQTPTEKGKGILVTPTTWGNLMIGPDAEDTSDREDVSSSFSALQAILKQARLSVPDLELSSLIRFFTGVRPASDAGDFIVGESSLSGFIQAAGIESPGLTSAPAIAEKIRNILLDKGFITRKKRTFYALRSAITRPAPLQPASEVRELVQLPVGDPDRLVCRCEQVREKTVLDALNRGIPIDSLDAVKRRTRAGMGLCQGTFCGPRVKELLMLHTGLPEEAIGMPQPKDQELLKALRKL
jgi:glycerol-3-phosphate dehydrogenase